MSKLTTNSAEQIFPRPGGDFAFHSRFANSLTMQLLTTGEIKFLERGKVPRVLSFDVHGTSDHALPVEELSRRLTGAGVSVSLLDFEMATSNTPAIEWASVLEQQTFEQDLYSLCRANRKQEAIAKVLDFFDDHLVEGRFAECDCMLRRLRAELLDPSVMVAILGITIKAKWLKGRAEFYERGWRQIAQIKGAKYAKELLIKYR